VRSKYCFRPEDLSSVVFWFDNVYTRAITEHPGDPVYLICYAGTKKKTANLRGLQFFSLKKDLPFYGRFFVQKSPDFFLLPSVWFVASLCFWKRNADLIPKRVRRYFQNSYSYPNAVRRSVRTSSCSLIILINETCLRQHS
jgi:hypothetical protein